MNRFLLSTLMVTLAGCAQHPGSGTETPATRAVRGPTSFESRRIDPGTPARPPSPDSESRVRTLRRRAAPGLDPAAAAREHLAAVADRPALSSQLQVARVHDTGRGPLVVTLRQSVGGVPVFRGATSVVMTRDRELVAVTGRSPSLVTPPTGAAGAFTLDAPTAIARALADMGVVTPPAALVLSDAAGDLELYRLRDPARAQPAEPIGVRRVLYPVAGGVTPAYHVQVLLPHGDGGLAAWALVVAAADGRVLLRHDRRREVEAFTYRLCETPDDDVFLTASPYGNDGVPHPTGVPDGYQPSVACTPTLVQHGGDVDPWLADDATTTRGNNVDVFTAICADAAGEYLPYRPSVFDAAFGDFRGSVTGPRLFDHPYDQSLATSDRFCTDGPGAGLDQDPQVAAKLVQAFAFGNFIRDLTYRHGFDEAAGNMQDDNYGRGGRQHDALRILVGGMGTFALPTSDGLSPYLSLGRSSGTLINRDMSLDLSVSAHEWMHIMQHRLVGDGEGLTNSQGGALGEGWSDFFGLMMLVRAGQDARPANSAWTGVYTVGGYANTGYCSPRPCTPPAAGSDQSWYFGIRRYPSSVDLAKSPLTFRYIENDVPLPAGIPQTFWQRRRDNAEIHNAGEIWASALWHCYRELLLDPRNDFAAAQGKMLDYLIAGLKATPVDPTFTEARDALLAVVGAADATDLAHFRAAFAARGMGAGAVSPPRDSVEFHGVAESFASSGPGLAFVGATLDDAGTGDADGILDAGETGVLRLVFRNTGFVDLGSVTVAVEGAASSVSPATQVLTGAVSVGADLVVSAPLTLLAAGTYEALPLTLRFADATAGLAQTSVAFTARVSYDVHRASYLDDAATELNSGDWEVSGWDSCYHDIRWTRVDSNGGALYAAMPGRCSASTSMSSPWIALAAAAPLTVTFAAAFDAGSSFNSGTVEVVGAAGEVLASQSFDGTTPGFPALSAYSLQAAAAGADRLVRLVMTANLDSPAPDGGGGFLVDDIGVTGAQSPPFTAVSADGAAAPAGAWGPSADFTFVVDERTVRFTDSSVAGEQPLTGWAWSFGDGGTSSERTPTHVYALPGEYLVQLVAIDAADVRSRRIALVRPQQRLEPGVRWNRATGNGTTMFFVDVPRAVDRLTISAPVLGDAFLDLMARPHRPIAGPSDYWGTVGAYGDPLYNTPAATVVVDAPPTGRWHIAVTGAAASVLVEVTGVQPPNEPPAADFTVTVAGQLATFTDASRDDSAVVAWAWTFGDGSSSVDRSPQHRYAAAGTYTVTLTVTDDDGATSVATREVTVQSGPFGCGAVPGLPGGGLALLSLLVTAAWRRRVASTRR